MKKLKMQSADLATDNIEKLGKLFPNCITESIGDKGEVIKAIDFDLLRQEFSDSVVEGPRERYHLNWPGKQESLITANTSINKTLRPCHEESVDFDSTKNLFIEGENLDALKLLQETYLGKVKMIYIDPPYNTGKDFIYSDKFKKDKGEYEEESGQVDEEGNRLVANTESKGRFHSDWLSMMYPRLKLARNLLKDDGVIFVSIDDNEVHNLRKICNEVFGEENFIADLTVVNNLKGRNDKKYIATANERLLMFVKSYEFEECGLAMPESRIAEFKEEDSNGKFRFLGLRKRGGADTREQRPKMYFPIYANQNTGNVSLEKNDEYNIEILPKKSDMSEGCWRWGKSTVLHRIGTLLAKPVGSDGRLGVFEKDYLESDGELRRIKPKSVMSGTEYSTDKATKSFRALMKGVDFTNPKSTAFLKDLISYASSATEHELILDFFAGSATTAHAVMDLNAEDGGNRNYIMIQLPEECGDESEAFKSGFINIAEISKERIRRAGTKVKEEKGLLSQDLDIGFRVLKIDSTNMEDVYYRPDEVSQDLLSKMTGNIKPGRTEEDLLFQVMLDWAVDLSLPVKKETIKGNNVYLVDDNALSVCFVKDGKITEDFCKELAKLKPLRVVFRDEGFKDDSVKINVEQVFKLLSPETEVRTI